MSRKITKLAVEAFLAHKPFSLGNTRVEACYHLTELKLHGNVIARKNILTGKIEITTTGWNTATTKERLNGIPDVRVYTHTNASYT